MGSDPPTVLYVMQILAIGWVGAILVILLVWSALATTEWIADSIVAWWRRPLRSGRIRRRR